MVVSPISSSAPLQRYCSLACILFSHDFMVLIQTRKHTSFSQHALFTENLEKRETKALLHNTNFQHSTELSAIYLDPLDIRELAATA